jgi:hypothetical protein
MGFRAKLHSSNREAQCTLWVKSGHGGFNLRCPLYPQPCWSSGHRGALERLITLIALDLTLIAPQRVTLIALDLTLIALQRVTLIALDVTLIAPQRVTLIALDPTLSRRILELSLPNTINSDCSDVRFWHKAQPMSAIGGKADKWSCSKMKSARQPNRAEFHTPE